MKMHKTIGVRADRQMIDALDELRASLSEKFGTKVSQSQVVRKAVFKLLADERAEGQRAA